MLLLLFSLLFFQEPNPPEYSVTAEVVTELLGVKDIKQVGNHTVVSKESKISSTPLGVITVLVPPTGVTAVTASDEKHSDVILEQISSTTWVLQNKEGTVWITAYSSWIETQDTGTATPIQKTIQRVSKFQLELIPSDPDVDPVDPVDPPTDLPLPGDGLRVLFIYDQGDTKVSPDQRNIPFAKGVRDLLNAKCVKVGDNAQWRVLDQTAVGNDAIWMTALKRPRKSLPWLLISNGKTGYEGPLPSTIDETIKLIGKYAQ